MLNVRERRAIAAKSEAAELIAEYGAHRTEVLLNVHRTTVTRWLSGEVEPPTAVLIALRAALAGMPSMWPGWSFGRDGLLYGPGSTRGYSAGDVLGGHCCGDGLHQGAPSMIVRTGLDFHR